MPREIKQRVRGQKQVNPQQTFDFTVPERKVEARPIGLDQPTMRSNKAQQIADFAANLMGTAHTLSKAQGVYSADQKKKGALSAAKGEGNPERGFLGSTFGGETDAFIEGYENFKGDTEVGEYHKAIDSLLNNAADMDDQQWLAEKEKISQSFINGRSDAFLEAFVPKAADLESKYDIKFHQMLKERVDKNFLAGVVKIADSDITRAFTDDTIEDKDKFLRDALSVQQDRAKALGMANRNAVSAAFIGHAINKAEMTGNPNLLGFTLKPDKDGIILAAHPDFNDKIATGISNAITAQKAMEKEERLAQERQEKKFAAEAGKVILDMVDEDPAQALEAFKKAEPYLTFEMKKGLRTIFNDLRSGSDTFFAPVTDQNEYNYYRLKARYGNLDLEKDIPEMRKVLKKDAYAAVFQDYIHYLDTTVSNSRATKKSPTEITLDKLRSAGHTYVAQKDKLGNILAPQDAAMRAIAYEIHFGDLLKEMGATAGGVSKLDKKQQSYLVKKALWLSFQDVAPVGREKMPEDPDHPTDPTVKKEQETKAAQTDIEKDLYDIPEG